LAFTKDTNFQAEKMINPKINALLLCVVCVPATGTPNEQLIDLLTCSPKSNSSTLQAQVKSGAIRSAGEAMVLAKPVSTDKACVKNATILGSFGTLSVLGESCGTTASPLIEALKSTYPNEAPSLPPGVLFMGKSGRGEAIVYKGSASVPMVPSTTSSQVAYMCSIQLGGTQ
jgi:hypothetical protein